MRALIELQRIPGQLRVVSQGFPGKNEFNVQVEIIRKRYKLPCVLVIKLAINRDQDTAI